jgi:hypothetical protein
VRALTNVGWIMADSEAEPKSRWWRKLLTVPGVIATTILTAVVGAGVSWTINYLQQATFRPSDAIKLSIETDPAKMSGVSSYGRSAIIPSTVRTHGTPGPGCAGFHSWMADNQGVDAGKTALQIAAQGSTDKPVLIQNMVVTITDRSPPRTGINVVCATAGGAQFHSIAVDLDATPPKVDFDAAEYSYAPKGRFGFTLAKGETESFIVTAFARKATYRWRIEFDVVIDGVAATMEVGGSEGYTTTVEPPPFTSWDWNHQDSWQLDSDDPAKGTLVPGSQPLPPP